MNLDVLNALRHQRFWHIRAFRDLPGKHVVLNALRHQRFWHSNCAEPAPTQRLVY